MLETVNEKISVNKIIANKKEIIIVEGDIIVPDSKPDVLNVICTSGVVCVYKKEILNDKVRIDGNIDTYIMYLADSENDKTRGISTNLDFVETINVPGIEEGMQEKTKVILKSIESKVINGRKLGIKATLEVQIQIYSNEEIEIVNDITDANEIQMLKESLKINSVVGAGETKIYTKETIKINEEDNLVELLKANICIGNEDIKISYNKILTKAEANVKIMYLTEDGRIRNVNAKIPIVGFVDIPNVMEENICDVNYEIKNIIIKLNPVEEHSLYIEMEVCVEVTVYEEKEVNLIQDLYSPCDKLEFNKKNIKTIMNKQNIREIKHVRERFSLENLDNCEIIDVDVTPVIDNIRGINDKVMCEGNLELSIIVNKDIQLENRNQNIPFNFEIENVKGAENIETSVGIEIANQDFIVQEQGNINSNIDLLVSMEGYESSNLNVMDSIDVTGQREDQDYSVVMYIVKQGDTLWNIAKKFGTTINDIVRANGIEDENKIHVGEKLFIPKYTKIGVISA